MPDARYIRGWAMIAGVLMIQGCWEDEQFTLLGEGGCRLADGSEGEPKYLTGLTSEQCQAECSADNGGCTAVEYNTDGGLCEIHSGPIVKFEGVEGVFCYVRN
jgi:PAN domain